MKHFVTLFSVLLLSAFAAQSQNTLSVAGKVYDVDTLYHAVVGPGTTQTSLQLSGPGKLRVFYVTIDRTNPYVSFAAVCSTDMVAGSETVASMAKRHSSEGKLYYTGVNGDFFATSGTASNGKSIVGTPTSACIVDGEIFKTSSKYFQFTIDDKGVPFIGTLNFTKSMAEVNGKTAHYKAVNVTGANNGITLYTPRYYGCSNQAAQANASYQVLATLVEGDTYSTTAPFRLKVISEPTATGDIPMGEGEYVIHGRGTSVESGTNTSGLDFVKDLKVGDVVTFTNKITIDGTDIIPTQVVSGNPHTVGNGETLDTESTRGDAKDAHPRTGIGFNHDKTKVIMMVVDGRSTLSQGLRTSGVADLMRYAGAAEAINLDGGGSSTLYTSALGVRNVPSDGNERSDGDGIFAVCNAPEDNEIAEIRFKDWSMKFPQNGEYRPTVYGYNKYGMLVNKDVTGFELSCPEQLGTIIDKDTFWGNGIGTYALTAKYNGLTASIPVTIVDASGTQARLESVVYDGIREYAVEVQSKMYDELMKISPRSLKWSSSDESIVKIDESGILTAGKDGDAIVTGTFNDEKVTINVSVQKPTAKEMPIDKDFDPATWSTSVTGATNFVLTPFENGMKMTYTGSSSRSPRITLTKTMNLWSLPDKVIVRINPGDALIKSLALSFKTPNGDTFLDNRTVSLTPNAVNEIEYSFKDMFDTSDMINFPIEFRYMSIYLTSIKSGTEYAIEIPAFETVYDSFSGVEDVIAPSTPSLTLIPNPVAAGETLKISGIADGVATVSIYTMSGTLVAGTEAVAENNSCEIATAGIAPGLYLVRANHGNGTSVSTLIIK